MNTASSNPNRLLVVDDDPGITEIIAEVARDLGFEVATVASRSDLQEHVPAFAPTVVTLDLSMPDIDGIEVLTRLSEHRSLARIMLSSGLDARLLTKAREIGEARGLTMLDDLPKPFDIAVLERRLAGCLVKADGPPSREELAAAIEGGRLRVFYQPKIDLAPGQGMSVVGAEALVRWDHETRGILGPDAFIGLAEQTGLILPLTDYVFREAVNFLALQLKTRPDLLLAVNLSAESFNDQNLPGHLQAVTGESGASPSNIVIEVTESTAMADVKRSLETMTRLRVKGFGLSLDDFGTGFSSLSYLHRMPFTELKVDRSFVSPLKDSDEATVIVRSVIDLAHNLGLSACAEGVEDTGALEKLLSFGADTTQGYLFARPMPADEFARLLKQGSNYSAKLNTARPGATGVGLL